MTGLATGFFQQLHIINRHATVGGFAHVVDCQECDLHGGERLHFHTGLITGFGGGPAMDAVTGFLRFELDLNMGDGNRVAQRDQFRCLFCRHDPGDAGDTQDIAFFMFPSQDQFQRCRLHADGPFRNGNTL